MALADSISAELLAKGNGIRFVDRSRLQDYLFSEHIPFQRSEGPRGGALACQRVSRQRRAHWHDRAVGRSLQFIVGALEGRAGNISVLKGIPFGLNEAAIKAVSGWTFKPAAYDGKPVPVHVPIEVTFRLY